MENAETTETAPTETIEVDVKLAEVLRHVNKSCKTCQGSGVLTLARGDGRFRRVCGCALRRFAKSRGASAGPRQVRNRP